MSKAVKPVEPRFTGHFSVYDTPSGGIHIAWIAEEVEDAETQHIEIPAPLVEAIKTAGEGGSFNPAKLLKSVMSAAMGAPA